MPKGFHVVCLEPGADNPKEHAPVPAPEPPEGFVDNTVYRYRIDEDGNKVLIGTMPAFPENWDAPLNPFRKKEQGEGKMSKDKRNPGPKREDREEIMEKVRELVAKGTSVRKAAKLLNVPESTIYHWLKQEREETQKQAQEPVPVQVGSQEPERENQEPANQSVAQEKPEFTVKDVNQKLQYELAQREQGFGPEDEEPIPYVPVSLEKMVIELRDDLNLERHKVAALEKKMELLASALPAGSRTSQENRLAKLLVAVFRELGDAGTA